MFTQLVKYFERIIIFSTAEKWQVLSYLCLQGAIPIDDEEDVDGDTNDDFVDPWGVVFKPLKVGFIFSL